MISRLLALTITAALALGVAGSATGYVGSLPNGEVFDVATGTWDRTHTYGVNGTKRTCTLTRGAKCVGAKLRGKVKHHGDLRKANLRRADLRFADLRGANLQGADLRSANLDDINLVIVRRIPRDPSALVSSANPLYAQSNAFGPGTGWAQAIQAVRRDTGHALR